MLIDVHVCMYLNAFIVSYIYNCLQEAYTLTCVTIIQSHIETVSKSTSHYFLLHDISSVDNDTSINTPSTGSEDIKTGHDLKNIHGILIIVSDYNINQVT